jgi:hypothetical protein
MMHIVGHLDDQDLVLWSQEQARALREEGRRGPDAWSDWENVAEEIERLGTSDRRAGRSLIAVILEHVMKGQAPPAMDPVVGWMDTILRARVEAGQVLVDSSSLRREGAATISQRLPKVRELVRKSSRNHDEQPLVDLDELT